MRKYAFFGMVVVILAFQVGTLTSAQADAVGRLTQVEGRVDILRSGQLPAIPVKVNDGVQTGDVLRTKSMSKAQITFVDSTTLTISPESRVSIEAYIFDSAQNKRNAVVQLFQGLAQVVVSKLFKAAEPDFIVKSKTAVIGVRGTDFGVRIYPNSTDILNFEGLLQVGNILPDVGQLFRRAFKVAYSFDSAGAGGKRWVFLKAMQGTSVPQGKPPGPVFTVTPGMKDSFLKMFSTSSSRGPGGVGDTGGGTTRGGATGSSSATGGGGSGIPTGSGGGDIPAGGAGIATPTDSIATPTVVSGTPTGDGGDGIPTGGGTAPGSGFLGLYPPGTGGIIPPVNTYVSGTQVDVITPPQVPPVPVIPPPPPPPPTTTTTTTLPTNPPR